MASETNYLEFMMKLFGSAEVAAGLDRVIKGIDGTSASADGAAVSVDRFDQTLRVLAGALDKDIIASDRAAKSNAGLSDSYKFVSLSADQSVASINSSTAAYERNATAAASASSGMRNLVGGSAATGLIKASKWIAGGALLTGYESIKKYMSFQQTVTQSITQAGVPLADQKAIMSGLLDISTKTGEKANDMAATFYRVASSLAGTHTPLKRMLEISTAIAKLNVLGNVPAGAQSENTARVVMSIYNANLKGTGRNLTKIIGTSSAIAGSADAYIKDVSSAFGNGLLAAAQQQGLSMADAGAIFAAYTKLGMKPASAGVYATRSITQLFSPTVQGEKGLQMLGINPFKIKEIQDKQGFPAVLQYLNKQLQGPLSPLPTYAKYKGSTGAAAAYKQLNTWFNGALSQTFQNQLGEKVTGAQFKAQLAADLKSGKGITPQEMDVVRNMMITRMFGGQRGSVQVAALLDNLPSILAAAGNIAKNTDPKKVNELTKIALTTPGQQFKIIEAKIAADFIKIGQTITPIFLKVANALASFFGGFTKFKYVIEVVGGYLGEVLLLGAALKAFRTGLKIFDFFKNTLNLKKLFSNVKTTEPIVAAGAEMQAAAKIQAEAAGVQFKAAEMLSMGRFSGAEGGGGFFLREEGFGTGRKPIGLPYAEQQSRVHAGAMMPGYMGQGVKNTVENTAKNELEKHTGFLAKIANSKLFNLGSSALSMLPGIGTAASIALPLLLPFAGSAFSFLGGLFGGGAPKPVNAATQTSLQKATAAAQKQIAKDQALLKKNPNNLNALTDLYSQQAIVDRNTGNLKGKQLANNFAYLVQSALPKAIRTKFGLVTTGGNQAELDKLTAQMKANPAFASYVKQIRPLVYGQLMGFAVNELATKNAALAQAGFENFVSNRNQRDSTALGYVTDKSKPLKARLQEGMQANLGIQQTMQTELKLSKTAGTAAVRKEYLDAYQNTKSNYETLHKDLIQLSKDNKGQITPKVISDLAKQIAAENKQIYTELGFSSTQFAQAVTAALAGTGHWKVG